MSKNVIWNSWSCRGLVQRVDRATIGYCGTLAPDSGKAR